MQGRFTMEQIVKKGIFFFRLHFDVPERCLSCACHYTLNKTVQKGIIFIFLHFLGFFRKYTHIFHIKFLHVLPFFGKDSRSSTHTTYILSILSGWGSGEQVELASLLERMCVLLLGVTLMWCPAQNVGLLDRRPA